MPIPDGVSLEIAAALPPRHDRDYLVSDTKPLRPGDRCLIHARRRHGTATRPDGENPGAEVVATAGSPEKGELARSAGADHVVLYNEVDLVDGVEAAVGTNAIDVVFDGVGAATFDAGLHLLAPRHDGDLRKRIRSRTADLAAGVDGQVAVPHPTHPHHSYRHAGGPPHRWNELNQWIADGDLEVRIGHTFPLTEAAAAHTALEGRSTTGKILLLP